MKQLDGGNKGTVRINRGQVGLMRTRPLNEFDILQVVDVLVHPATVLRARDVILSSEEEVPDTTCVFISFFRLVLADNHSKT
jgi:hypothetical protein